MLDAQTPRGQDALRRQYAALDHLVTVYPDYECAFTDTHGPARIDALLSRRGVLAAVVEVKTRDITLAQLREYGSYLVSLDKITTLRELAATLWCKGVLLVALLDATVWWTVAEHDTLLVTFTERETETPATINGGVARRQNAYLALHQMQVLP